MTTTLPCIVEQIYCLHDSNWQVCPWYMIYVGHCVGSIIAAK